MDGGKRREEILNLLQDTDEPMSGSKLAKQLGVSRQVIVQDIALLRAQRVDIMATARGYLLHPENPMKKKRVFVLCHTRDQIEEELNTVVDYGGNVLDVIVEHPIYGQLTGDIMISSRRDVQTFLKQMKEHETGPLMQLTNRVHMHTIEAKDEETLDEIEAALKEKGYLYSE